jgi:integrase
MPSPPPLPAPPCEVRLPRRTEVQKPKLVVPTAAQLADLLSAAKGHEWEIPILLSTMTGARRSETLALGWEHVDLDKGSITITRSLQRMGKGEPLTFLPTKSDAGERTIKLPAFVIERLRVHHKEQIAERMQGKSWTDNNLVCCGEEGQPLSPDEFSKAFKKIAARAGLDPRTSLHDVRHAVATDLGRKKVHPVIVAATIGHSNPRFTMAVYQHAWEESSDEAAQAIGDALGF